RYRRLVRSIGDIDASADPSEIAPGSRIAADREVHRYRGASVVHRIKAHRELPIGQGTLTGGRDTGRYRRNGVRWDILARYGHRVVVRNAHRVARPRNKGKDHC